MKKTYYILITLLLIIPLKVNCKDITKESSITLNGNKISEKISDNNENTYITIKSSDNIKITSNEDIYGLYIIYEMASKEGTIKNDNKTNIIGENNFLHEYINIEEKISPSKEITLSYKEDVKIGEIYILSKGELPSVVEVWNKPCEKADILLFSTHSDDEQLFFLGLLPTYVARGAYVQVVYFTNHYDNPKRLHEQLHGLYVVGVRNYPIIGIVPDAYSKSLEGALSNLKKANLSEVDALNFEIEMIRRFKPQVVVGHDELGEYSHGQHILNTYVLKKAIEQTNNKDIHPSSYEKYGVWDTPKLYLHLYKENEITMDYDTPLDYFNGLTAYEVSKLGYKEHHSQQWTWFTKWINGSNNNYKKATEIKTYSPLKFGLYRSLVGEDINKNDMLENITYYKDQIKEESKDEKDNTTTVKDNSIKKDKIKNNNYIPYIIVGIGILILLLIKLFSKKKNHRKY